MSMEQLKGQLRVLSKALNALEGVDVTEAAMGGATPGAIKKLGGIYPDELLEGLQAFSGAALRFSGPSEQGGALRVPSATTFSDGLLPTTSAGYNFDTSKDVAFAIIDHQDDSAMGLVIRDAAGKHRYACAYPGKEAQAVTVADTFAGYLEKALGSLAHRFWAFEGTQLADGKKVEESIKALRDRLANGVEHAKPNMRLTVSCEDVTDTDLDEVRRRRVARWVKHSEVAKALKVPASSLHEAIVDPARSAKELTAALKKQPRPDLKTVSEARAYLLADVEPNSLSTVQLTLTGPKSVKVIGEKNALVLADAPGADALRRAIGELAPHRFDWLTRLPAEIFVDVDGDITVSRKGDSFKIWVTLPKELVPSGARKDAKWPSIFSS